MSANKITLDKILEAILVWLHDNIDETATENSTVKDLGLDSLDQVEAIMFVEEQCGCAFNDDDLDFNETSTIRQCAEIVFKAIV